MKIRKGFVSNSSSSSFVCDVCNQDVSGMDISLSDYEMISCSQGHITCYEHIDEPTPEQVTQYLKESGSELTPEDFVGLDGEQLVDLIDCRYDDLPEQFCPLCQMKHTSKDDMLAYLLTTNNMTRKQVTEQIASKFDTYSKFKSSLKK